MGGLGAAADRRDRRGGTDFSRQVHPPRRQPDLDGRIPRRRGLGRRLVRGILQLASLLCPRRQRVHRRQGPRGVERHYSAARARLRPRHPRVYQRRRLVPQRGKLHLLLSLGDGRSGQRRDAPPGAALCRILLERRPGRPQLRSRAPHRAFALQRQQGAALANAARRNPLRPHPRPRHAGAGF